MYFKSIFLIAFLLWNYSESSASIVEEANVTSILLPESQRTTRTARVNEECPDAKQILDVRVDVLPANCQTAELPTNCAEATACTGQSGIYRMRIPAKNDENFLAYCDDETDCGEWLVIQTRKDGTENFNRSWSDYKNGFGQPEGEYWLGLEKIYALTNFIGPQELYVHLEDFDGFTYYAKYDNFQIASEEDSYRIKTLGLYTGTATDSMSDFHLELKFVTYDHGDGFDCAKERMGGWWFGNCANAYLNGKYFYTGNYDEYRNGIYWKSLRGYQYSFKSAKMMIRRKMTLGMTES